MTIRTIDAETQRKLFTAIPGKAFAGMDISKATVRTWRTETKERADAVATAATVVQIFFVDSFCVFCQSIFSDYQSQKEDSRGDTDTHRNAQAHMKKEHTTSNAESCKAATLKQLRQTMRTPFR